MRSEASSSARLSASAPLETARSRSRSSLRSAEVRGLPIQPDAEHRARASRLGLLEEASEAQRQRGHARRIAPVLGGLEPLLEQLGQLVEVPAGFEQIHQRGRRLVAGRILVEQLA
jgi:hypothetical protein